MIKVAPGVTQISHSPFLTAWTWGGAEPQSRKERLSGLSGIFTILDEKRPVSPVWPMCVYTCVCLSVCVCSLTPWPWWRPAAAGSVVCRRPGWSWFPPRRRAWGTAGPRWWCRSSCPPAGQPSGWTDRQTGDRMLLFLGCSLFQLPLKPPFAW